MEPDKEYMATHPHRLLLDGDSSMFLKLTSPEDSEQLYELVHENRAHLRRYVRWAQDMDFEEMHQVVLASAQHVTSDGFLQYRIMLPNASQRHRMIGTITLYERDLLNRTAKLAFWMAEDEKGNGYMRRGIVRLLQYADLAWRLQQVFLEIHDGNGHADQVAQYLGAQPTDDIQQEVLNETPVVLRKWVLDRP